MTKIIIHGNMSYIEFYERWEEGSRARERNLPTFTRQLDKHEIDDWRVRHRAFPNVADDGLPNGRTVR